MQQDQIAQVDAFAASVPELSCDVECLLVVVLRLGVPTLI